MNFNAQNLLTAIRNKNYSDAKSTFENGMLAKTLPLIDDSKLKVLQSLNNITTK